MAENDDLHTLIPFNVFNTLMITKCRGYENPVELKCTQIRVFIRGFLLLEDSILLGLSLIGMSIPMLLGFEVYID